MNPPTPSHASSHGNWRRDLALLGLIFAVLFGLRLGGHPLANPDEARYAEIPREMVAAGEWVTPRLNGVEYFEKPPLMYWAVAVCRVAFGPGELAMRLAPALFALAGVLITYAAARRIFSRQGALPAAVVLGTSLLYFGLARTLLLDMAVSVLMSATLFCFILGVREPVGAKRRWFFYGLYASAALAVLTKGLIGVLLSGLVMFLWLLVFNQWKRLRPLYLPTGLLLFLAIALPWHLLVAERNPGWAHFYFVQEHWERFTTTEHGRYQPFWYFLPVVIIGLFPWMGFVVPAVKAELKGGWAARKENADKWFFLTWAVVVFLFFSKSQSKLIPYILPVFPPLAVLVGAHLGHLRRAPDAVQRLRDGFGLFGFVCLLLGAGMFVAVLKPGIIKDAAQLAALRPIALAEGVLLLAGAAAVPWLAKRRGMRAALLGLVLTVAGMYAGLAFAQVAIARPSTKELARIVSERARPGDVVLHYRDFFHDFTYYAEREVSVVGYWGELQVRHDAQAQASGRFMDEVEFRRRWEQGTRIWAVARKRAVGELFGDPGFRYHLIAETRGHYLISNQP